jgi:hypothetical protein
VTVCWRIEEETFSAMMIMPSYQFGFWASGLMVYVVLRVVTSVCREPGTSIFSLEDGGGRFVWDVGNHLPDYMVSWPRRPRAKFSPLWKSGILNIRWHEMEVSGHILAALSPGKELVVNHWIGGCVGPRSGLKNVEKRKISAPALYWAPSPLFPTCSVVTVMNVLSQLQQGI